MTARIFAMERPLAWLTDFTLDGRRQTARAVHASEVAGAK
jgi:hypothetical protein